MNRISNILVILTCFSTCHGQQGKINNTNGGNCNRAVDGVSDYIKLLPTYICIPANYIIDDYVCISDLDSDGLADFIAVKYNKKEDDQLDGDTTYWNFYIQRKGDSLFHLAKNLSNIAPPFIVDLSWSYQLSHPIASKIYDEYPRRLSHAQSFNVQSDTLRLAYKFDDSYGKRFVFVYNGLNWYLEDVEYFLGELPMSWWKHGDFWYPLNDALKVIETKKPKRRICIDDFDLRTAFKYRDLEREHLGDWHVTRIDESKWQSAKELRFNKCKGIDLPDDWIY